MVIKRQVQYAKLQSSLNVFKMVKDISEFMSQFYAAVFTQHLNFKCCVKQEKQTVYIPRASLMTLTMFGSLDGGPVSGLFSSAFNLFFWLYNSNSTLRKPMQYRRIPNAEMMVAMEGKRCFWGVIFIRASLSLVHLTRTWYVSLLLDTHCHLFFVCVTFRKGKDQIGFGIVLSVVS